MFVADNINHRVVRYGPAPNYAYRGRWGSYGSRLGQLQYPRGLSVDAEGNTYVADPGGNRIDVFDVGGDPKGWFGSSGRVDRGSSSSRSASPPTRAACAPSRTP